MEFECYAAIDDEDQKSIEIDVSLPKFAFTLTFSLVEAEELHEQLSQAIVDYREN